MMRKPSQTSHALEAARQKIRERVAFYHHDRLFAPDIEKITQLVLGGEFHGDGFCTPDLV